MDSHEHDAYPDPEAERPSEGRLRFDGPHSSPPEPILFRLADDRSDEQP
ncbi:MAG: hypothetical protein JW818_09135 [Pirellulales bacterium]|nr:hypothetical protein [Pirellulales bacterium]